MIDWTSGCNDFDRPAAFTNKSEAELLALLGVARSDIRFKLGEGLTELRGELQNLFPLPANAERVIREMEWARGRCHLTIWLAEQGPGWNSVQAVRWPEGMEF